MKYRKIFIIITFSTGLVQSQEMSTSAYRDLTIPYIESNTNQYNFGFPILSNMLTTPTATPPDVLYLKSDYGHRYMSSRPTKTDNHGGFDYWPDHFYNGIQYDENNKIDIVSMCDGVISEVINGTDQQMEQTGGGRSVQVKCNQPSQVFQDIKINYRHLHNLGSIPSYAEHLPFNTVPINAGDVIGKMGESGFTSNVHLHLSMESTHPVHGNAHLNTARLFNPNNHQNIIAPLTNADIHLLHTWDDKALFRVVWPYNQTINRFEFINDTFQVVFDKEEAYEVGSATRDDHDAIDGIQVFAYQFNGKQTASSRYENEKSNMPAIYPASPQRDNDLNTYVFSHFPITNDEIVHVYDFIIEDLPSGFNNQNFMVKLSDVWGYTVEGNLNTLSSSQNLKEVVRVFPNPSVEKINLVFKKTGERTIDIYTISGKRVLNKRLNSKEVQIDISHLSDGIYFMKIKQGQLIQTEKIIISNR